MSQAIAAPANRTTAELHCVRCGQSGHLSKDCPWPANPRARAHLAVDVFRCIPATATACAKVGHCARATDWPATRRLIPVFDASTILAEPQGACEFFIDARAQALEAA